MKVIEKKLAELIPYENNPRHNEEAVEYVANSIQEFGWRVPIVIDANNVIIAGHTRYKAAEALNIEKVPCVVADDLTEEQVKAYRLADNKTSEKATWDMNLLELEMLSIDLDMSGFGFDDEEEPKKKAAGGEDEGNFDESDFNYKEQYGVMVLCQNEADQEEIYNRLTEEGYQCKVVAT